VDRLYSYRVSRDRPNKSSFNSHKLQSLQDRTRYPTIYSRFANFILTHISTNIKEHLPEESLAVKYASSW